MNVEEFKLKYGQFKSREIVRVPCDRPDCTKEEILNKDSALRNIQNHGEFVCRTCAYTEEGRKKISEATSYARSDKTKKKMSDAKKAFFQTPEGEALKTKLSLLAVEGHSKNLYEKSKRSGWHNSPKAGPVVFMSSYELYLCVQLDKDEKVKTYETQVEYECNGRNHSLDFLIIYTDDSKRVIEVKPLSRLNEAKSIQQINDSSCNAIAEDYMFSVYTEENFNMTCKQIRDWADEFLTKRGGFDFVEYRKELANNKSKRYYSKHIANDTITYYCTYCKVNHTQLKITYDKTVAKNGRPICEREGGHIAGSRPKPHLIKENPYAAEGKKECNECREVKSFELFSPDKTKRDGYSTRCKTCRAAANQKKYQEKKNSSK